MTDTQEALNEYERHKYAASAMAARSSVERTWRGYHAKGHQLAPLSVGAECFPMTVEALARIAALMKLDKFRSFGNYASWAKAEHDRLGHAWSQQLALELKAALRSLGRGLGLARQSQAFDFITVATIMARQGPRTRTTARRSSPATPCFWAPSGRPLGLARDRDRVGHMGGHRHRRGGPEGRLDLTR